MNRFQLRPLIFSLCLIMAMGSTYVMAQEEEAEAPQIKEERKSLIEMERYTGDLLSGLTPDQAQYLYEIRVNFGNIYSVGVATQQVEDAVKACTKKKLNAIGKALVGTCADELGGSAKKHKFSYPRAKRQKRSWASDGKRWRPSMKFVMTGSTS